MGKKKVLIYVLIIYSIMVAITSFASNFTILVVSRTVQGVGLGIFPLAFSLVREQFPRERGTARAEGILSAMFGAGAAFGLPIGALIANSYGWQTNYHIALPFIAVLTVLIYFIVRESSVTNPNSKLDYPGAVWLGAALGAIVFGLSEGSYMGLDFCLCAWSDDRRLPVTIPSSPLRKKGRRADSKFETACDQKRSGFKCNRTFLWSCSLPRISGYNLPVRIESSSWLWIRHPSNRNLSYTAGGCNTSSSHPRRKDDTQVWRKTFPVCRLHRRGNWILSHFHCDDRHPNSRLPCHRIGRLGNSFSCKSESACAFSSEAPDGARDFIEHCFSQYRFESGRSGSGIVNVHFCRFVRYCRSRNFRSNQDGIPVRILYCDHWFCHNALGFFAWKRSHWEKRSQERCRTLTI